MQLHDRRGLACTCCLCKPVVLGASSQLMPRPARQAFEAMTRTGCAADAIAYGAIIDALWDSGLAWAQRRAAALFHSAAGEGLLRRLPHAGGDCLELSLASLSAGVAVLSLYAWLADLRCGSHICWLW